MHRGLLRTRGRSQTALPCRTNHPPLRGFTLTPSGQQSTDPQTGAARPARGAEQCGLDHGIIGALDEAERIEQDGKVIDVVPVWRWLLQ